MQSVTESCCLHQAVPLGFGCSWSAAQGLADMESQPLASPDSAGSLRRGAHVLNMALAMHSWVLPSADLAARLLTSYPLGEGKHDVSRGQRAETGDGEGLAWAGPGCRT